jgi:hypothetical protein
VAEGSVEDVDEWSWVWHTGVGMIAGFIVAVGAWSVAAQAQSSGEDRRPVAGDGHDA